GCRGLGVRFPHQRCVPPRPYHAPRGRGAVRSLRMMAVARGYPSRMWLTVLGVHTLSLVAAGLVAANIVTPAPSLWEPPSNLSDRDLFNGPWGESHAPDPRVTYTYMRPKEGGFNPGVVVRDDRGRVWHVKQAPNNHKGDEGPVEVVLSRVLSAVGYRQPPVYYPPAYTTAQAAGRRACAGARRCPAEPAAASRGEGPS